jgi:hypothetical protein
MDVLSYIHDPAVIERILRHLHRWDPPAGLPSDPVEREVIYDEEEPVYEEIDEPP